MGEVMKTNQGLKLIYLIMLGFMLSACSLNSSDNQSVVGNQMRGSRSGNLLTNGGLAIDLPIANRPEPTSLKWARLMPFENGVNAFLSLAENQPVVIPPWLFQTVDVFFWGDLKSSNAGVLQIGNQASEQQYFNNLDASNFEFELSIWDDFTDSVDPTTNKKYDYLGYAYFGQTGSNQVGQLSGSVFTPGAQPFEFGVRFTDSKGDMLLYFNILRQGTNSTMNGVIDFRSTDRNQQGTRLGTFAGLRVCDLFNCQ
jgi:hypothetical protein